MASDSITPVEVPRLRRSITLSNIDLSQGSIPPAPLRSTGMAASEAEAYWQALRRQDELLRALAGSFQNWRDGQEARHLQAEDERRTARMKAMATLVAAVVTALGGALAAVIEALR
jgi:hypothetical protein